MTDKDDSVVTPEPEQAPASPYSDDATKPTSKTGLLWYLVGVAALVALIAGVWVLNDKDAAKAPDSKKSAVATNEADDKTADSSSPTSQSGSPSATGTAGSGAPKGSVKQRPTAPAAAGSKLTTLTTPPQKTIAMISKDALSADATYDITFEPFGRARLREQGLVIAIKTSAPVGKASADKSFAGRTAFAILGDASGFQVTTGGLYKGTLGFKLEGDGLVLVLTKVAPAK